VQEVYGVLSASHASTQLAASTAAAAAASGTAAGAAGQGVDQPAPIAAALAPGRAKGLIGLFSTEGSREPVSKAVANLWTTPRMDATTRLASVDPADRYFPRQTQSDTSSAPAAPAQATTNASSAPMRAVNAPLPPSRPVELTQPAAAQAKPVSRQRRAPLDLSSFMLPRARS
jgi:hypothetical protein